MQHHEDNQRVKFFFSLKVEPSKMVVDDTLLGL
jgi:hypothetical protein